AVRLLDDRGAFQLRKAVEEVADALGVSRFTVYNYLNAGGMVRGCGPGSSRSNRSWRASRARTCGRRWTRPNGRGWPSTSGPSAPRWRATTTPCWPRWTTSCGRPSRPAPAGCRSRWCGPPPADRARWQAMSPDTAADPSPRSALPAPVDLGVVGADLVVTMDDDRRELPGGWVACDGGFVTAVGDAGQGAPPPRRGLGGAGRRVE